MRDIWAVPPGGSPARRGNVARTFKIILTISLIVLLGVGAGIYSTFNDSTAVTAEQALEEFRSQREATGRSHRKERTGGGARAVGRSDDRPQVRATNKHRSSRADQGSAVGGVEATPRGAQTSEPRRTDDRAPRYPLAPPAEGVYAWSVEGYEEAPGVRRDLPTRSHRIITHDGKDRWIEHHVFSEQREEWFDLVIARQGVSTAAVRNKVQIGPLNVDETVVFDPPVLVGRFPFEVGATWEGQWSGTTRGHYTARTFDHTSLVIGGKRVEVWATEVVMEMQGDVNGTATTRSWVSPKHRLVVKQYQDTRVENGPGTYHHEWTGQLLSLDPRT